MAVGPLYSPSGDPTRSDVGCGQVMTRGIDVVAQRAPIRRRSRLAPATPRGGSRLVARRDAHGATFEAARSRLEGPRCFPRGDPSVHGGRHVPPVGTLRGANAGGG